MIRYYRRLVAWADDQMAELTHTEQVGLTIGLFLFGFVLLVDTQGLVLLLRLLGVLCIVVAAAYLVPKLQDSDDDE